MSCRPTRCSENLGASLLLASVCLVACGGAQAHAPAANDARQSSAEHESPKDNSDSLKELRSKLASGLGGATELNLAAKGFGPGLGALLADSPDLAELRALDVSDNDLGIDGVRALTASTRLTQLRELDLGGNDIGDDGASAVAHSPTLAGLETLNVSGNSIAGSGATALAQATARHLSSLDLSMNGIGESGASALARTRLPLQSLYLLGCEIGTNGVRLLAQSSSLSKLTVLALSGNNLGDEGAQALAKSATLSSLTTLDLCANGIGDDGALALAQSPQLKKLRVIELYGNDIGSRGAAALKKRFGARLHL